MKLILIVVSASSILYSCSPKSYCFFNVKERMVYLTNEKDDSIRAVTITSTVLPQTFKRNIEINPPVKSYTISDDSVFTQSVYFFITTNNAARYSLKLKESDWAKDTVFKCRYLIR